MRIYFVLLAFIGNTIALSTSGGYERLLFFYAYLMEHQTDGPYTIAPGCMNPGGGTPCSLRAFIEHIDKAVVDPDPDNAVRYVGPDNHEVVGPNYNLKNLPADDEIFTNPDRAAKKLQELYVFRLDDLGQSTGDRKRLTEGNIDIPRFSNLGIVKYDKAIEHASSTIVNLLRKGYDYHTNSVFSLKDCAAHVAKATEFWRKSDQATVIRTKIQEDPSLSKRMPSQPKDWHTVQYEWYWLTKPKGAIGAKKQGSYQALAVASQANGDQQLANDIKDFIEATKYGNPDAEDHTNVLDASAKAYTNISNC